MTKRTKVVAWLAGGLVAAGVVTAGLSAAYGGRDFGCGGHGAYGGHGFGPNMAGGPGGRMARLFERFDTNQDSALSAEELDQGKAAIFADFDRDSNDALNLEEFERLWLDFARPHMVDRFQMLDDDGDAAVTRDEFGRPLARITNHLDRNRDGVLERSEMRPRHRWYDDDRDDEDDDS